MPLHGLFCGAAGARRLAKWTRAQSLGRAINLGGAAMYEVYEPEGGGVANLRGCVLANSHAEAESAFPARKAKLYAKQVN